MIKDKLSEAMNINIEKGRVYLLGYHNDDVKNDLVEIVNNMKEDITENPLIITDNTSIPSIERSVGGMAIGTNIGVLIINELELIEPFKVRDSSRFGRTARNIALAELKEISLKYEIPVIVCYKMEQNEIRNCILSDRQNRHYIKILFDIIEPSDFVGFIYRNDKEVNCWVAKNRQSSDSLVNKLIKI
ncbi:hypothetical protein D3C79_830660 [compost metagenome]